MKIRKQDLAFAQFGNFARQRLFDLDDHVRGGEDLICGVEDGGACGPVVYVADAATDAGVVLNDDLVSCGAQRFDAAGNEADAILVVFDSR